MFNKFDSVTARHIFTLITSVQNSERLRVYGHRFNGIGWRVLAVRAAFGLAMLMVVFAALPGVFRLVDLQIVAVNGHSMGQSVPDGSIVVTRAVGGDLLRTDDVIVFRAGWLEGNAGTTNVVHRLSLIVPTPKGLMGYTTGDANVVADPLPVNLRGEVSVVKAVVPYVGNFYGTASRAILFAVMGLVVVVVSWFSKRIKKSVTSPRFSNGPTAAQV